MQITPKQCLVAVIAVLVFGHSGAFNQSPGMKPIGLAPGTDPMIVLSTKTANAARIERCLVYNHYLVALRQDLSFVVLPRPNDTTLNFRPCLEWSNAINLSSLANDGSVVFRGIVSDLLLVDVGTDATIRTIHLVQLRARKTVFGASYVPNPVSKDGIALTPLAVNRGRLSFFRPLEQPHSFRACEAARRKLGWDDVGAAQGVVLDLGTLSLLDTPELACFPN